MDIENNTKPSIDEVVNGGAGEAGEEKRFHAAMIPYEITPEFWAEIRAERHDGKSKFKVLLFNRNSEGPEAEKPVETMKEAEEVIAEWRQSITRIVIS